MWLSGVKRLNAPRGCVFVCQRTGIAGVEQTAPDCLNRMPTVLTRCFGNNYVFTNDIVLIILKPMVTISIFAQVKQLGKFCNMKTFNSKFKIEDHVNLRMNNNFSNNERTAIQNFLLLKKYEK